MGALLHRTTIGRTRELRGPDALELGIVGIVVTGVMVMAAGFGSRVMLMTQSLDAITLARAPQVNASVYRAEHGRWPPADDGNILGKAREGQHVQDLTLADGGVITAQLSLVQPLPGGNGRGAAGDLQGRLSFRPELLGSREEPAVSFLCGYAQPVGGTVEADAVNRTTFPEEYLPPFCR